LGTFADLYAYKQRLTQEQTPTVAEFKNILKKKITLDHFLKYFRGSLSSIFSLRQSDAELNKINIYKYENTEFFKSIHLDDEYQELFLRETIASYENFIAFIGSQDVIDHTYMWDIMVDNNPELMAGGLNIVIVEVVNRDITQNVQILCPTLSSSYKIFDVNRETCIILKHNTVYEPIYLYEEKNGKITKQQTFKSNGNVGIAHLNKMFYMINANSTKCLPNESMPKVYKFKNNIFAIEMAEILTQNKMKIHLQIINYEYKVIGLVVEIGDESGKTQFVPCEPSSLLNNVAKKWMDEEGIWNDYMETLTGLRKISEKTGVPCLPKLKVVNDGLVVGFLTETNQFVQIDPPNENIHNIDDDFLPTINDNNHFVVDKIAMTTNKTDEIRQDIIDRIHLETEYYIAFRTFVRNTLNEYENTQTFNEIKKTIEAIDKSHFEKLEEIIKMLKMVIGSKIKFQQIDLNVLKEIKNIQCPTKKCNSSIYCLRQVDGQCQLSIPDKHLLSGVNNEELYFARIADELIRFDNIKLFMLNKKTFLNITDDSYKINHSNEIILNQIHIESYFKNIANEKSVNYGSYSTYTTAEPQTTELYNLEPIKLQEQKNIIGKMKMEKNGKKEEEFENTDKNANDIEQYILEEKAVQGKPNESVWKRIFNKSIYKEIVFKTTPEGTFGILIYIYEKNTKNSVSIVDIKNLLIQAYEEYIIKYKMNIANIWKLQKKGKMADKILKGKATIDAIIMDENYFCTDFDVWLFSIFANISVIYFNKNKLNIDREVEWKMFGNYNPDKYYFFIRSPSGRPPNDNFQIINNPVRIVNIPEFFGMVQDAMKYKTRNLQDFQEYLVENG